MTKVESKNSLISYKGTSKYEPIESCCISKEDLLKLYKILDKQTSVAVEKHLSEIPRLEDKTPEEDEALRQNVRELGKLTVIINNQYGEQIVSQTEEDLKKENLPDKITFIAFDSAVGLENKQVNIILDNKFRLELDFSEPPGFNEYNPFDSSTPNKSSLFVNGKDSNWAIAVSDLIKNFFKERGTKTNLIHSRIIFVLLSWLILVPVALWTTYRLDPLIVNSLDDVGTGLRAIIDVYLFLLIFALLRTLVWSIRWAYPIIEIKGTKNNIVRWSINFLGLACLASFFTDFMKYIF